MPSHSKEKHGWGLGGLGWFQSATSVSDYSTWDKDLFLMVILLYLGNIYLARPER